MPLPPTPSQTVGPFFAIGLVGGPIGAELVSPDAPGAIRIRGRVTDGADQPVPDAMVEIWQAGPSGRYAHPVDTRDLPLDEGFLGFGRSGTVDGGSFEFLTVKPGPVPGPDGRPQAPHINASIFARGLLKRVVTRIYFPDEEEANAVDPVLSAIADADARATLVAEAEAGGALRFEIRLQGNRQTTFFAV